MPANLKLESFSDREILFLMNDLGGDDGWVDLDHLAERIGITRRSGMNDSQAVRHAHQCVAARLGHIRRLSGTVEREEKPEHGKAPRWGLTSFGAAIVNAELPAAVRKRLEEDLSDAQLLRAVTVLSARQTAAVTSGRMGSANLLRREWTYGTHKNRRA